MVKTLFIAQKFVIIALIAISLSGCRKEQKAGYAPNSYGQNGSFAMPLDCYGDSGFALNEDVEAFVLEEEQFATGFDGSRVAYNHDETLTDYTLEQVDAKEDTQVVYFPYDSKDLDSSQKELLKIAATKAQELVKEGKTVCCKGHSCLWHGTRAYNLALSQSRANVIANYLEKEAGIPQEKIKIFGVGTEEPIAFEETKEGQAPNRRVEVYALAV